LDFEEHVKRTTGFWCNKLTQRSRTTVFDKIIGEHLYPYHDGCDDEIPGSQFGIRGNVHMNWEREDCKKLTKKRKKNEKRST
jgi:hypothetical protein